MTWLPWAIGGAVVLLLIVVTLSVVLFAGARSHSLSGKFTAKGEIEDYRGAYPAYATKCQRKSGVYFSPLSEGDEVVISDAAGKVLAFGNVKLDEAKSLASGPCVFTFTVDNVPSGQNVYQMTVEGKDAPHQTESDLKKGISLTIGKG